MTTRADDNQILDCFVNCTLKVNKRDERCKGEMVRESMRERGSSKKEEDVGFE